MRLCWILFLICPFLLAVESEEEALFLRRIADFWEEGEYQIAKGQMETFIAEYPESPYADALCAALGDLYLREKNFSSALNCYTRVQTPEFYHRVFLSRMQCLYEMQWYATLADECESYLENGPNLHATYFLAIALYQQCLNAAKDSEMLPKLAQRAQPYLETLMQSELSNEVAPAYAYLCCILKDYAKASDIYLELAKKDPATEEEMLFQVALIQSEYDKERAMQTFDQIAQMGQKKGREAIYNRMVLAFDLGHHEVLHRDLLDKIPPERKDMGRLFLARSLLHLKKYDEATAELKHCIDEMPASDMLRAALLTLLEASYQADDLSSLDQAIAKLTVTHPQDPELPKAHFSRAQILKKNQDIHGAKEELEQLLVQFPQFQQKAQVLFELTHLEYKAENWESCYKRATAFLEQFPGHELASFAWRYLLSSSAEMAVGKPELQRQLIAHLEAFLKLPLADSEKAQWEILLAKTHFDLKEYEQAIARLQHLETPNARLLQALCYLDGRGDREQFCKTAETALSEGADLIDPGQIHTALFNTYLKLSQLEKAADHLWTAFQAQAEIQAENLLWLADIYFNRLQEEETHFALAHRTALLLSHVKSHIQPDSSDFEQTLCKLAKVYAILGRTDEAIALLETLSSPGPEAQLLLAENYVRKGILEKATQMFDAILSSSTTLRTPIRASASLQAARLQLASENPDLEKIATQLKNLVIQKNFEGEPVYLEAALDYVEVQSRSDLTKKVTLLQKTKLDFENRDTLLSKDYHEARARWPRKNKLYQGYLQLIDAEILAAQAHLHPKKEKDLKEKAKHLLLQIVNEQNAAALLQRARMLLTKIDAQTKP